MGKKPIMLTVDGITHPCSTWERLRGLKKSTVLNRVSRGCCPEAAVNTPRTHGGDPIAKIRIGCVTKTIQEWAREIGKHPDIIRSRIEKGLPVLDVLNPAPTHPRAGFTQMLKICAPSRYKLFEEGRPWVCKSPYMKLGDVFDRVRLVSDVCDEFSELLCSVFSQGSLYEMLRGIRRIMTIRFIQSEANIYRRFLDYADVWAEHYLVGTKAPRFGMHYATEKAIRDRGWVGKEENDFCVTQEGWEDYLRYRLFEDQVVAKWCLALYELIEQKKKRTYSCKVRVEYTVSQELFLEGTCIEDIESTANRSWVKVIDDTKRIPGVTSLSLSDVSMRIVNAEKASAPEDTVMEESLLYEFLQNTYCL